MVAQPNAELRPAPPIIVQQQCEGCRAKIRLELRRGLDRERWMYNRLRWAEIAEAARLQGLLARAKAPASYLAGYLDGMRAALEAR